MLNLRNRIGVMNLIRRILEYSAKKIIANDFLLYSMLNPETNSDSPSEKSKGVRLVSAKMDVIQIKKIGIKIKIIGTIFCIRFIKLNLIFSFMLIKIKIVIIKLIS